MEMMSDAPEAIAKPKNEIASGAYNSSWEMVLYWDISPMDISLSLSDAYPGSRSPT